MAQLIALGFGNSIDYELEWSSNVVENLIDAWGILDREVGKPLSIKTERDLLVSILGFLKKSSGGERFVENSAILESFARYFKNKITIGGTCPRAGIAMSRLGYGSLMHLVTMNDYMRELLPSGTEWICSNSQDSSYPHVIVQFEADVVVRSNDIEYRTMRANRIIYNNNLDSMTMTINPDFFSTPIEDAKVFMISGFNAMRDEVLLKERMLTLTKNLSLLKKKQGIKIFYEDACFHKQALSNLVHQYLSPYIDIYSMNEDELQTYVGKELDLLNPQAILDSVMLLHQRLSVPLLVVHSRYWALAYGHQAMAHAACLKSGITMATTRFRFGDDFGKKQYDDTYLLADEEEGAIFSASFTKLAKGVGLSISSVQVAETRVTTIGLGDAFVGGFLPSLLDLVQV